jgi:hypothetical protein
VRRGEVVLLGHDAELVEVGRWVEQGAVDAGGGLTATEMRPVPLAELPAVGIRLADDL